MARVAVTNTAWTQVITTTANVLVGVEGGDVRFQTGSTTGVSFDDGHLTFAGNSIIFPAGLTVSAVAETDSAVVTTVAFG